MKSQKLTFENESGQQLIGRLDLPAGRLPDAYALFAHCFTCSKDLKAVGNISRALTGCGIAVFRFDFTGLGESEGDFANTGFSTNVSDLVAAANFLRSNYEAPEILIGHSLGGAAVLQAASQIPSTKAVATIACPAEPSHLLHLLEDKRETIEKEGEARITLANRSFKIKKQFLDDLEETGMQEKIRALGRALLIFHSPLDNIVGIENATRIFKAARHPKSFVSLDDADHLLSSERDSRYVGQVVAAWAGKYIEPAEDAPLPQGRVEVSIEKIPYRTEIRSGTHRFLADEPENAGGRNAGPSPYDYLLSALGACTAITLRMYADRKQWPLDAVIVTLNHEKIHAEDCEHCETKTGKIDRIERKIELLGSLDETRRNRLLEIADKCPVHRTLHNEIHVESRLKE